MNQDNWELYLFEANNDENGMGKREYVGEGEMHATIKFSEILILY